jgi:hypothetical protein
MAEDAAASPEPKPPLPWWQTLLTTPALLVLLGGGIGTAVPAVWTELKAWKKGVESSQLALLAEQQQLWTRNLGCAGVGTTWENDLPGGVVLKLSICPSGDLLVRWFYPGNGEPPQPRYRWLRAPPP